MAIVRRYEPSIILQGLAAYDIGAGQRALEEQDRALRAAQVAEQQRQFDALQGIREKTLDADIEQQGFNRNLAIQNLRNNRFALMQRGADSQADRQAQLMALGMREAAASSPNRLALEAMEQQGLNARQGAQFDNQAMLAAQQADAQLRNQLFEEQAKIEEGIQNGTLRYSPQQKAEQQRLRDALDRLRRDPRFTPQQRMMGEADIAQKLSGIQPQEVPIDERPVPLQQQFEQETVVDPNGSRWSRDRNGAWRAVDPPDDSEAKRKAEEAKIAREDAKAEADLKRKEYEIDLSVWQKTAPDRKHYEGVSEDGKTTFNGAAYERDRKTWWSERPARPGANATQPEYPFQSAAPPPPPSGMGDSVSARSGGDATEQPPPPVDTPQGPAIPLEQESDAERYGLQPGTVIILNGRVGVVE